MPETTISHQCQQLWTNAGANRLKLHRDKSPDTEGGKTWSVFSPKDPYIDGPWGAIIPDGLCVIDVDIKDGKPGLAEWARLVQQIPELAELATLVVDSPSGGFHVYLRIPPGLRTSSVVRGFYGIDVKGPGNQYVCGPGSAVAYTDAEGRQIQGTYKPRGNPEVGFAAAPKALLPLLEPVERFVGPAQWSDDPADEKEFAEIARLWFAEHGNHQRFRLAQRGADLGLTEDQTATIMAEAGIEPADKVAHAYRYRQNQIGCKSRQAAQERARVAFEVIPGPGPNEVRRRQARGLFVHYADIDPRPPEWLVEGMVERGATLLLIGKPEAFKSFVAIDWAMSVAHDTPWLGARAVRSGPVIYLSGEGHRGLGRRTAAWAKAHEVERAPDVPFYVSRRAVPLPDEAGAGFEALRLGYHEHWDEVPALLIVDTLARNLDGDENSAKDITALYQGLDDLREFWPELTVIIVHHLGKDESAGARGSSSLLGNADALFRVVRSNDMCLVVHAEKMKDAERPTPAHLQAYKVPLGVDEGDSLALRSLVIGLEQGEEMDREQAFWQTAEFQEGYRAWLRRIDEAPAGSRQKWFERRVARAVEAGHVEVKHGKVNLTLEGIDAMEKYREEQTILG